MKEPSSAAGQDVDREIGRRIRARRQELELSQTYVADLIGLTFQQMQKYETGENRVAVATLLRIAEVLRIEASDLLPSAKRSRRLPTSAHAGDPMAEQLQAAFARIESPSDKRLVLMLARKFASSAVKRPGTSRRKS